MLRRQPHLIFLSLLISAGFLCAQKPLKDNSDYQQGLQAIQEHLPELALKRFVAIPLSDLEEADRLKLQLFIAEAHVRASQALEATTLLEKLPQDNATVLFWLAQAQTISGKYTQAISTFQLLLEKGDQSLHSPARLNMATLLHSLKKTDEALTALQVLHKSKNSKTAQEAKLRSADILLTSGKFNEAEQLLLSVKDWKSQIHYANYLKALLALKTNKAEQAVTLFSSIVSEKSLPMHLADGAQLGLAQAQYNSKKSAEAVANLTTFINEKNSSPLLGEAFELLSKLAASDADQKRSILERLEAWLSPPSLIPHNSLIPKGYLVNSTTPVELSAQELHALYYYASLIPQDETGNLKALRAFHKLRLTAADTPLSRTSLLDSALRSQALGKSELSAFFLQQLENATNSPELKATAAFLRGQAVQNLNQEEALVFYQRAAEVKAGLISQTAEENAAIIMLMQDRPEGVSARIFNLPEGTVKEALRLELALSLARKQANQGKLLLEDFIKSHPDHPRLNEIKLALADAMARDPASPLAEAQTLLDSLIDAPDIDSAGLVLTRMAVSQLKLDHLTAIQLAKDFLETHNEHPQSHKVRLSMGLSFFHSGQLNDARITLEKLANNEKTPSELQESALFFAALSASRIPVPSSREAALTLLEDVIKKKGLLVNTARRELADQLITFGRYEEALVILQDVISTTKTGSEIWLRSQVKRAEAYLATRSSSPEAIKQAIQSYDTALEVKELRPKWSGQLNFLKGLALEEKGDLTAAMDHYYQLLNRENTSTNSSVEWLWFEKSGFRLISLLENEERWKAAVAVAKKLAKAKGPKSTEAAERANRISLEHMIFDSP